MLKSVSEPEHCKGDPVMVYHIKRGYKRELL